MLTFIRGSRCRESDSPEARGKESLRFRSLRRVYQNLSPFVSCFHIVLERFEGREIKIIPACQRAIL